MHRRRFLTGTAAATALAVAGCTQEPGDRGDGTGPETTTGENGSGPGSQPGGTEAPETTTDGSETPTDDPETTTDEHGTATEADESGGSTGSASDQAWGSGGRMNGVDFSFSSQSPETGENRDEADISRNADTGEVHVTGTISGSDSCKRAQLGSLAYDESTGSLAVGVETTDIEDCEMAAQALVGIDYEGTFEVDGDLPTEITVSHDGREVAGASYDSASATEPTGTEDAT